MIKPLIAIAWIISLGWLSWPVKAAEPDPEAVLFFENKVRPLLHQHCLECHSDAQPESELSLESYAGLMRGGKLGAAVIPGKPKESLLISAVNHDEFLKMPPKSKLTTAELATLHQWVSMGAPWPDRAHASLPAAGTAENSDGSPQFTDQQRAFWAYQPLVEPEVPEPTSAAARSGLQGHSAIDRYIQYQLDQQGLQPGPVAGRRQLLRRATYDLTGLSPTPDELTSFATDDRPDAYERALDRLLASPRYGEKWGRHWLDVARYADSNGLDENIGYPFAYRYRDYVIDAFNHDKPYDRFIQEQIAGDLLPASADEASSFDRLIATGFLAIGAKMLAEDDPVKMQMDIIDEQLTVLCQAFMGMTIGCARCHDHKYDPITAADYYALAGIFKSSQTMEHHNVVARLFERPLADAETLAQAQQIDEQLSRKREQLNQLNHSVAERVKQQIRSTVSAALQATVAYQRFATASQTRLATGINHTDAAGPGFVSDRHNLPYTVEHGYALIEAEGFHRGSVGRDYHEYGQQIGIIGSSGTADVEYDITVEQPGRYAIEIRYAAVERRPLRLKVDNRELNPRVATETGDSWYHDGQMWTVGGLVKLDAGKHVIRLESRRAFPHIDKLAIVYQVPAGESWPTGAEPLALSRAGLADGLTFPIIALWRSHLAEIQRSTRADSLEQNFYATWLRLAEQPESFAERSQSVWAELQSDSPLHQQTPAILRQALLDAPPQSLAELAQVYAAVIARMLQNDQDESFKELRDHVLAKGSPLSGLTGDHERFYLPDDQTQADLVQQELAAIEARRPVIPRAMGIAESQPQDLKIHLRGSHLVLGKLVARRMPSILSRADDPPISAESSGRLQLAQWITRPDHPLTSRVMANRIWHWHFGRGIVPTTDNFGLLGLPPGNQRLLDWLAVELVKHDWSVKHLHRQIMLSGAYQRSSRLSASDSDEADRIGQGQAVDPGNNLLWRFNRRRLTAEETRDAILEVGAGLDRSMYGSLMKTASHQYVNSAAGGDLDYNQPRRSIYLPVIRSGVLDEMQTLDFPDPAMISGERQTSTVAPQALMMLNSDLVHAQSLAAAQAVLGLGLERSLAINAAYIRILRREAGAGEVEAASVFLQRALDQGVPATEAWQSLCRVLIASNEFSYIE